MSLVPELLSDTALPDVREGLEQTLSMAAAARCRTSCYEADVRCQAAVDLTTRLPVTFEALTAGALPWAQAVTLARETRDLTPAESSAASESCSPIRGR